MERNFFTSQTHFLQEYWMYFKKNWGSMVENSPLRGPKSWDWHRLKNDGFRFPKTSLPPPCAVYPSSFHSKSSHFSQLSTSMHSLTWISLFDHYTPKTTSWQAGRGLLDLPVWVIGNTGWPAPPKSPWKPTSRTAAPRTITRSIPSSRNSFPTKFKCSLHDDFEIALEDIFSGLLP